MINFKILRNLMIVGILFIFASSCKKFLVSDQYFDERLTVDKLFANKTMIEERLAHCYSFITGQNADVSSKGFTPHCFSDDMYYGDRDVDYDVLNSNSLSYNRFHLGNYTENEIQGSWGQSYKGIRNASEFIENLEDRTDVDLTENERIDFLAQARFIRAYYYWLLLRKYGPIPILPDKGLDYTKSYEELAIPRSTYEECAEYISNEMIKAAKGLPLRRDLQSVARPTVGAALATRAKALLFAASPLMNGNPKNDAFPARVTNKDGEQLLSLEYDEKKWARAAAAAKDVMDLGVYSLYVANFRTTGDPSFPKTITPPHDAEFSDNNWPNGWADIDPYESYRSVFNGTLTASENPELIFTRGQNQSSEGINTMVAHQLPRIASGWNTHGMTQKQSDAYYMNDGNDIPGKDKEIGRGDGSNRLTGFVSAEDVNEDRYLPLAEGVSLQYANREPRFYASVAYNGSEWHLTNESDERNREKQVFYYRGDGNGYTNTMFHLRTGIGIMKFVHPRDTYENGEINHIVPKAEPAIRYADILLMYAEALNELDGSFDIPSWDSSRTHSISRNVDDLKKGIRPVRIRAGVPDYSSSVYSDKTTFRAKLKRERQIELMGEGKRYYDLRRWEDASVELSIPIYGCNILMTSAQRDLFHTPVEESDLQLAFSPKMYFWPISHTELKRNNKLSQNPGWTYND